MKTDSKKIVEDILNGNADEAEKAIFADDDLIVKDNIFDDENLQNSVFSDGNLTDKHCVVQIIEEMDVAKDSQNIENNQVVEDADEKDENQIEPHDFDDKDKEQESKEISKDIKQIKEEKEDHKYGKFKTPEELLHAYGELEKEFTRRSQRLKELENAKNEPFKSDADWKMAVDKFFEETPSAKVFAKDIANEIINHPELKQDKNCLYIALTRTLVSKFRTPEQLMSDGQFLNDYVLCSKEVKDAVIREYLQGIKAGEPPFVLGGGGMQFASSPKKPKTIEEAGFMFLKENK